MVEKPSKKKQKDDRAGGSGRTNRRERVREEPQGLKALAEESRSIAALKALRHPKARFAKDCGLSQQAAGLQVAGLRQMPQPARRRIWAWCTLVGSPRRAHRRRRVMRTAPRTHRACGGSAAEARREWSGLPDGAFDE